MNTFIINEEKFWEEIQRLKEQRDEHTITSAEYIELDAKIKAILAIFKNAAV